MIMPITLRPGLQLPPVTLPATTGDDICIAMLSGRAVIIIYPWTGHPNTPNPPSWDDITGAHGSTPELEGLRDAASDFARCGARLFGFEPPGHGPSARNGSAA
jgi:peroxiredoxin